MAAWWLLPRPFGVHELPDGATIRFDATGWDLQESSRKRTLWTTSDGDTLSIDRVEGSSELAPFDDISSLRDRSRELTRAAGGGLVSADVLDLEGMTAAIVIYKRQEQLAHAYTGMVIVPARSEHFIITMASIERGVTGARDSLATTTLLQEGELDLPAETGRIPGYTKDPYDSDFDAVAVNSVADDERFDALLPLHPLSKLRRTLRTITGSLNVVDGERTG